MCKVGGEGKALSSGTVLEECIQSGFLLKFWLLFPLVSRWEKPREQCRALSCRLQEMQPHSGG